jgi:hypothetical protein
MKGLAYPFPKIPDNYENSQVIDVLMNLPNRITCLKSFSVFVIYPLKRFLAIPEEK